MKTILQVTLSVGVILAHSIASAATVQIVASRDNTLYQPATGSTTNSNGAGEHLFAGRTDEGYIRRGVIAFDLTNFIPSGSTITGVTLTMNMSRTKDRSEDVTLHRLLAGWGEGTSNAAQEEGKGTQAATGDATWYHRFYPTTLWAAPGGDFRSTASALTTVSDREGIFTWSSASLVADVQLWLNNPGTNFGWLIRGGEGATKTTRRFDTHELASASLRPFLQVNFITASAVGACCIPDGSCVTVTSNQCTQLLGVYHGDNTSCVPFPCPPPIGACCLPSGDCTNATALACGQLGGVYQGDGTVCTSNLCPVILTPFVDALPLPAPLQPVTGTAGGAAYYEVPMQQVQQKLHRDLPLTTVWAYGTAFPGPLIEATVEQPVTVKWINNLRDANGNLRTNHYLPVDTCLHGPDHHGDKPLTVVHLHGGKVAPKDDGYPEETFLPGQSRTNHYGNIQPPGTIWFHDHALGITRLNVYMGLAGLYLIRDAFENSLGLPAGANEAPLVIQDRKFHADGSLSYPAVWDEHFFGDTLLVNGKVWPYLIVKRGKYRFRVVNGSTSRSYVLGLSSGASFHQVGTDAGLLEAPVPISRLTIMPGERADLVLDFAPYSAGTQLFLTNSAPAPFPGTPGIGVIPNVMKFVVTNIVGHTAALPAALRPIPRLQESNAVVHRDFVLRKGDDPCTGSSWLINDLHWDDLTEFPVLGTTEVWSFINRSGVAHPMHLHLVLMQILDRQPFVFTNAMVVPTGPRVPPAASDNGWKDTVPVNPGEIVRVIARFDGFAGRYPYHCHILEHEDHEMMRQFEVVLPPEVTEIRRTGGHVELDFRPTTNRLHFVQRSDDLGSGAWASFTNNIPGIGTNVTVTDPGAATQPKRFYRIGLSP
jgi:FtsP/CotA-like multicopper oxidase with cupredoxin domain